MSQHSQRAVQPVEPTEGAYLLATMRELRQTILDGWQQQAVTLAPDERWELIREIRETCSLLRDLTAGR